jgi:hypothetical protein
MDSPYGQALLFLRDRRRPIGGILMPAAHIPASAPSRASASMAGSTPLNMPG